MTAKLFSTKQFRPAVREALLTLETRMRKLLGLDDTFFGKDLVIEAKNKGAFKRSLKAEEEGLYFLYAGAIQWLRNPPGHKKIKYDKEEVLKIILFVDYLTKLFENLVSQNINIRTRT